MKRGATKEEIIRTTQEFITRNGIRAVRVDEIAQTLGISKRTLYEMFNDKNDLIGACLDAMSQQQQERIAACRRRRSGNPLQKTIRLMNEYIENLYQVDKSFLTDLRRKQELLLPEIDAPAFANQLLVTLLDLRLNGTSREEVSLFCRTILRGAATRQGIELIDRRP